MLRSCDYNGFCPDDDGPATDAERQIVADAEDYLAFTAQDPEPYRRFLEAITAADRQCRETIARYEELFRRTG